MNLARFRSIVDASSAGIMKCGGDPIALCLYLGLDPNKSFNAKIISEILSQRIKSSFSSGCGHVGRACHEMVEEAVHSTVLDDASLEPYLSILEQIRDALRGEPAAGNPTDAEWAAAIGCAYDATSRHGQMDRSMREKVYNRFFSVARSAKRLRLNGFTLHRRNNQLSLTTEDADRLVGVIERMIKVSGGLCVAKRIFQDVAKDFNQLQERYNLIVPVSLHSEVGPLIPYGYLLLLAQKFSLEPTRELDDISWNTIKVMSLDYASTLDVQNYSHFAWMHHDAYSLLPFMRQLAVSDVLFKIPQIRGSDVVELMASILDFLDLDKIYDGVWTIRQVLAVVKELMLISRGKRGPICIDLQHFVPQCSTMQPDVAEFIVNRILSHPTSGANQNFRFPTDAPVIDSNPARGQDFLFFPLLRKDSRTCFWIERSVCAPACVEAIMGPLRLVEPNFDSNVGQAAERYIRAKLKSLEIVSLTGTYVCEGQDGECDIVVETADTIIFLELKKKPLTRRARAGADAELLLDLAQSLLDSQIQAGYHELRLRKVGFLDLNNAGRVTRLELRDRRIERLSVTLQDFGSFNDRVFTAQFLTANLSATYTVSNSKLKKKFDQMNSNFGKLRDQVEALAQFSSDPRQPFFHCWFLSVPQLLVLLDGVRGSEEFRKALWMTRHTSTGSADFYFDLAYMQYLHSTQAAAPTAVG